MGRCYRRRGEGASARHGGEANWNRPVARPRQRLPWEPTTKGTGGRRGNERAGGDLDVRALRRRASGELDMRVRRGREGGGNGGGKRIAPEGWTPELTRTSRPRLGLIARPEPPEPEA